MHPHCCSTRCSDPPSPTQANPGRGERAYSDLEVIKELRAMSNANKRQEKVAPRVAGGWHCSSVLDGR